MPQLGMQAERSQHVPQDPFIHPFIHPSYSPSAAPRGGGGGEGGKQEMDEGRRGNRMEGERKQEQVNEKSERCRRRG